MPVRSVTLNASKAGMTRLRDKGGASPETLYELTNAYINASRSPTQRPGTTWITQFSANTAGLVAFQGIFYAFTADITKVVSTGSYQVILLRHPTNGSAQLKNIHYVSPFMGYMYVVAEFADGVIRHYWVQNPNAWQANTTYQTNTLVQPTSQNGYYYIAVSGSPPPVWTPGTALNWNQTYTVQPTVYNGVYYTSFSNTSITTATSTAPFHSPAYTGPNEPSWLTGVSSITFDIASGNPVVKTIPAPTPPPATPPGSGDGGRYTNPGGSGGRRSGVVERQ